jgi:hypothetical protein
MRAGARRASPHGACRLIAAVLLCAMCVSASASPSEYTEKFDRDERVVNDGQGYSAMLNDDGWLAWSEAYVLDAYVEMYRTTRNRRYLDSLVDHFDRVLKNRDDMRGVRDVVRKKSLAGWGSSKYSGGKWKVWAVHTGMICLGPVDFVQIVRRDRRLRRDYGAKADDYLEKIRQCVAVFDGDWRNGPASDEGYYSDPEVGPLPLNQQNALGLVHLTLYQITGEKTHYYRVRRLAYYFKNRLHRVASGPYEWSYNPKPDKSGQGSEDISHASINIEFAARCCQAQIVFDAQDMRAFGKTWQAVRRAPGEWADNIDGTGGPNSHMPSAVGAWLNLARWDRGVYTDSRSAFAPVMDTPATGASLMGIAKLAWWHRYFEEHKR